MALSAAQLAAILDACSSDDNLMEVILTLEEVAKDSRAASSSSSPDESKKDAPESKDEPESKDAPELLKPEVVPPDGSDSD
jgi:hypothetical protein